MKNLFFLSLFSLMITSCGGPDACECVQQFRYWNQDGGMLMIDMDLIQKCADYYKDSDAYGWPDDFDSSVRNARKECD